MDINKNKGDWQFSISDGLDCVTKIEHYSLSLLTKRYSLLLTYNVRRLIFQCCYCCQCWRVDSYRELKNACNFDNQESISYNFFYIFYAKKLHRKLFRYLGILSQKSPNFVSVEVIKYFGSKSYNWSLTKQINSWNKDPALSILSYGTLSEKERERERKG